MNREWDEYRQHILDGIERIRHYFQLLGDGSVPRTMAYDAILRVLQTVTESAAYRLPDSVKERHPNVDWGAIRGMRNRLVHAYLDVDLAIVESTIIQSLDTLYEAMKAEASDPHTAADGEV